MTECNTENVSTECNSEKKNGNYDAKGLITIQKYH